MIKNVLINATSSEGPTKAIKNKVQQTQTGPPIPPNHWGNFGPKGLFPGGAERLGRFWQRGHPHNVAIG